MTLLVTFILLVLAVVVGNTIYSMLETKFAPPSRVKLFVDEDRRIKHATWGKDVIVSFYQDQDGEWMEIEGYELFSPGSPAASNPIYD